MIETTLTRGRAWGRALETIRELKLRHRLGHDLTHDVVLVPSEGWLREIVRRLASDLPIDNMPQVRCSEPGLRGQTIAEWIVDDVEVSHG